MHNLLEQVQMLLRSGSRIMQPMRQESALQGEAGQPDASAAGRTAQVLHPTVMMIMMDSEINRALAPALQDIGLEVRAVQELSDAVKYLSTEQPSCIIVSGPSGPHACEILRRSTSVPILALLPTLEDADMLATLDAGADDCQMASIGIDEIVLRMQALLRRKRQTAL